MLPLQSNQTSVFLLLWLTEFSLWNELILLSCDKRRRFPLAPTCSNSLLTRTGATAAAAGAVAGSAGAAGAAGAAGTAASGSRSELKKLELTLPPAAGKTAGAAAGAGAASVADAKAASVAGARADRPTSRPAVGDESPSAANHHSNSLVN